MRFVHLTALTAPVFAWLVSAGPLAFAQNQAAPPAPAPVTDPATGEIQVPAEPEGLGSALTGELESFLEPYIYDPKGRRDPFKPYVEIKAAEESELAGPLLPLQQFDLEQLRLVGIIWNVSDPKAMFVDPRNQVHVVRHDERIGKRNGYVAVIREGEVVVVEAVNVNGDLMYSTRVLKIRNKPNPGSS
jgi:type IV pilus assembly protein PilP